MIGDSVSDGSERGIDSLKMLVWVEGCIGVVTVWCVYVCVCVCVCVCVGGAGSFCIWFLKRCH